MQMNKLLITAIIILVAGMIGAAVAKAPVLSLVFLILLFILLVSIRKYDWLIYVLILLLPLGQLAKIRAFTVGIKHVPLFLSDVLIFLIFFGWILRKLVIKEKFYKAPLLGSVLLFISIAFISLVIGILKFSLSPTQAATSSLYLVRWIGYASLFYIIADTVKKKEELRRLIGVVLFSGFAVAIIGFLQVIFLPQMSIIMSILEPYKVFGFDPHRFRMVSTFLDPNMLGGFLMVFLFISIGLAYYGKTNFNKLLFWALSLLFFIAIILTFSRGTYLSVVVGLFVFTLLKRKGPTLLLLLLLTFGLMFLPPVQSRLSTMINFPGGHEVNLLFAKIKVDASAYSRIISWQDGFKVLSHNILSGTGYNTYYYASKEYGVEGTISPTAFGVDSSLLLIFVTTGIIGFSLYVNLLFNILRLMKKSESFLTAWQLKGVALGMFLGYLTLIIHSTFSNFLLFPFILELTWIFIGIVIAAYKIQINEQNSKLVEAKA